MPKSPRFKQLWKWYERFRSGNATAKLQNEASGAIIELQNQAVKLLNKQNWPYTVVELFLGLKNRTVDETIEAGNKNVGNLCEAQFYIGEWLVRRNDHE
jgi:hypothetical protein